VKVDILVDCEGTFARVGEMFPAVPSPQEWWLPFTAVLIRSEAATLLVDTGVGPKPRAFVPEPEARLLVRGEEEVAPGVHVFPTPGHTPGHMSVQAGSLIVLGDVLVHELQAVDPEIVYVSDHDPDFAAATPRRLLGQLADEGTDVIVSHFHGLGRFEHTGKGFRWLAVE
jgi:glyoxylase-like metal-dependent hydrolase (beta-lactamase superfamily II)